MSDIDVDLLEVVTYLDEAVGFEDREDLVPGKTAFRDALVARFGYSELDAEDLVDSLVARGFLRFRVDPERRVPDHWEIDRSA